jgi:6,7-dimethyl-8-ribityllumazine synthase
VQHAYSTDNLVQIPGARINIIQSKWHRALTDRMVGKCVELLIAAGSEPPRVHILPGTLELPLAAQRLAQQSKLDAIIAFGIIVKGDTYHFELVLQQVIHGFSRVMLDTGVPIIQEVLPVSTLAQAEARSGENDQNKGIEAALAAAEVIAWHRNLVAAG